MYYEKRLKTLETIKKKSFEADTILIKEKSNLSRNIQNENLIQTKICVFCY